MPETSISLLERLSDRADRDAWRRLVDLYSPLIAEWLRRYGVPPSEVDDLVQEVLGVLAPAARVPAQSSGRRLPALAPFGRGQLPAQVRPRKQYVPCRCRDTFNRLRIVSSRTLRALRGHRPADYRLQKSRCVTPLGLGTESTW